MSQLWYPAIPHQSWCPALCFMIESVSQISYVIEEKNLLAFVPTLVSCYSNPGALCCIAFLLFPDPLSTLVDLFALLKLGHLSSLWSGLMSISSFCILKFSNNNIVNIYIVSIYCCKHICSYIFILQTIQAMAFLLPFLLTTSLVDSKPLASILPLLRYR